jgi:type III pantothenate kinase
MNLLIDIGNTNLRWGLAGADGLGPTHAVRHDGGAPLDLIAAWDSLAPSPDRVLVANVGGAGVADAVARVVRALWGIESEPAVCRSHCLGVRIAYADPGRLGVDRWLALLAAQPRTPGPKLIIDAGTAVTYDLLLGDGRHLGGLILPGVAMMRRALLQGTRIPQPLGAPGGATGGALGDEGTPGAWATDTDTALAWGGPQALASLADRLTGRLASASGDEAPSVLLTGGDGALLGGLMDQAGELIPDLVLLGLARLAAEGAGC